MAKPSVSNASEVLSSEKIVSTLSILETAKTLGFGTHTRHIC